MNRSLFSFLLLGVLVVVLAHEKHDNRENNGKHDKHDNRDNNGKHDKHDNRDNNGKHDKHDNRDNHDKKNRAHIPQYTSKYDNIDIDAILKNDRIFKNYIDCCLGKARCTPDGQELKSHIRDAMENNCDKCSELHKKTMKKVGKKLYRDKPQWWKELCDHFDPDHKYRTKYQSFIDSAIAEKD